MLKNCQIPPHNTRYDSVYAPASTLYSQKMISLGWRLIAWCKTRSNFSQTNV